MDIREFLGQYKRLYRRFVLKSDAYRAIYEMATSFTPPNSDKCNGASGKADRTAEGAEELADLSREISEIRSQMLEVGKAITNFLAALDPDSAEILKQYYIECLTIAQISAKTGKRLTEKRILQKIRRAEEEAAAAVRKMANPPKL